MCLDDGEVGSELAGRETSDVGMRYGVIQRLLLREYPGYIDEISQG